MAEPFGDTLQSERLLTISSDNASWGKSWVINHTGTIYFDFETRNHLPNRDTVIYIKWHRVDSSGNYNGGGTLNLANNQYVDVTY